MKAKKLNMVKGGILGAAVLLGFTACSDDHFDVLEASGTSGSTVWQNIKANPELSDFAEILSKTRVLTADYDKNNRQPYSAFLNSPQYVTVWAPKNGTYDSQTYLDKLAEIEALRATGSAQDSLTAIKEEYNLANRFVKNHIARFNYESNRGNQAVRMMNSKLCYYDAENGEFNGVGIDASYANIHSSNGMLQVLDGQSKYADNIFDFMSTSDEFSSIYAVLTDPAVDQTVFVPEQSVQGAMNEHGEMVYVDSVFANSNTFLNEAGALIKSEDSIYVAAIPTNTAWDEALDVVSPLFKYASKYNYTWSKSLNDFENRDVNSLTFNTDSLTQVSTHKAIIESLFFSPSTFPNVNKMDSTEVIDYVLSADSLVATNELTFWNKAGKGNKNPMFDGIVPMKASNGYIFPLTHYNVDPAYSFIQEKELKMSYTFNLASVTGATSEDGEYVTLTADNRNEDVLGEIEDNEYRYFEATSRGNLKVRVKLENVLSGHYRIKLIMVPNRICNDMIQFENDGVTEKVEKPKFSVEILDDKLKGISEKLTIPFTRGEETVELKQDSVSELVLWEDFEFPYSYAGLPNGAESFPVLEISMSYAQQTQGKSKGLSIHKVILEPVRNQNSDDNE